MMTTFQKTIVALAVVGVVGVVSSNDAHALKARQIIGPVIQGVTSYISGPFMLALGQVTAAATSQVTSEITKSTMANKAVLEGLEAYRQENELRKEVARIQEEAQLPETTCADMAAQDGINKAAQNALASTFSSQSRVRARLAGNVNTSSVVSNMHDQTNQRFCSAEDAARGICNLARGGPYQALAAADHDAAFMFQGAGNQSSLTHSSPEQTQAVEAYIERVVAGIPPEQLNSRELDRTEAGKAYIELQRRYRAMLSMSSYSLNYIKESHRPRPGLGNDTRMANVPGFPVMADMSMHEAVNRFVATKFSPEKVRDMADATQPHEILRDLAQTGAFNLWVDYQSLLQGSRMEALQAHQLALLTDQVLRPQLEAQRLAAAAAARSSGRRVN